MDIKVKQRFPKHIPDIADTMPACIRPMYAFDTPALFGQETDYLIGQLLRIPGMTSEYLWANCRIKFCQEAVGEDEYLLAGYKSVLDDYMTSNNCQDLWSNSQGFIEIIHSSEVACFQRWIINSKSISQTQYIAEEAAPYDYIKSPRFHSNLLFHDNYGLVVNHFDSVDTDDEKENVQAGMLENMEILNANMAQLTQTIAYSQKAQRRILDQVDPSIQKRLKRHTVKNSQTKEPDELVDELVVNSIKESVNINEFLSLPLPDFVKETLRRRGTVAQNPLGFMGAWVSPPPVFPSTIYDMSGLHREEITFLSDAFTEIYNGQIFFLIINFFLQRMYCLWTPQNGPIAPAIYSKELQVIMNSIDSIAGKLAKQFSGCFLTMEGFLLPGLVVDNTWKKMFTNSTVMDVRVFLTGMIEMVRDCALVLDRMRVSMLYGSKHPSYVGDSLVASYLYRYYAVRHTTVGFDSFMHTSTVGSAVSLPENNEKIFRSFKQVMDNILSGAKKKNILEPSAPREFKDQFMNKTGELTYVKRATLSSVGAIESYFPVCQDSEPFLSLFRSIESRPSVIHYTTVSV